MRDANEAQGSAALSITNSRSAGDRSRGARTFWRAAFSAAILGWLVYRSDWRPILHLLARARLSWCLGALAIYFIAQCISSWRWQILARALGFAERYERYLSLYFIGMFFNLFLPTSVGGDVVRAWYLAKRRGQGWLAGVSVFSERFSGLLALLLIACGAAAARPTGLSQATLCAVWAITAAAMFGLIVLPVLGRWNLRLRSLAQGLSFYHGHLTQWFGAFGLSFLVQGLSIVQVWLLGKALAVHVPLLAYAVVVPMVSLLTMLPISINGVGVREGSLVLLLVPAGATDAGALALGLLWFLVSATASLIGGGVYLLAGEGSHESVRGGSDQGREGQSAAAA